MSRLISGSSEENLAPVQRDFDFRRQETDNALPQTHRYILKGSRLRPISAEDAVKSGSFTIRSLSADTPTFHSNPAVLKAYLKAVEVLEAYFENPLSSLSCSKTMLLPHQVQAAMTVLQSVKPRMLIADEVGLGKTIEAGLILKELILKNHYKKVLICVPSPLVYQWRNELAEKLNENFQVLNGKVWKKDPDFLSHHDKIIVSIDLARDPSRRELFLSQKYDVVIFDEAHRLRRDQNTVTQAYQFAEQICEKSLRREGALLLLSATPFRGKLEEIYYLIRLIDPDILGPLHSFLSKYGGEGESNLKEVLNPVVIRRRKKDIGGFTERFAKTVKITPSPAEADFYEQVTTYVMDEYNRALSKGNHFKSFIMLVYQKILDSSREALLQALERRLGVLTNLLRTTTASINELKETYRANRDFFTEEDWESELEDLYGDGDSGLTNTLSSENEAILDPDEIRAEILLIRRLLDYGRKIEQDSKINILFKSVANLKKSGHNKIIIFTQFLGTLRYIERELKKHYRVEIFHGGLSALEKEHAVERFFGDSDIFLATEAGGEGRNLQIASAMINYDLPWSPLKLEQRIGRIHRYGQKKDVFVLNFATRDTVAEKVIDVLDRKIKLFEDAFGESDTLLGLLEEDTQFKRSFKEFLTRRKSKQEWNQDFSKTLQLAKKNVNHLENLLSTEVLDFDIRAFSSAIKKKQENRRTEAVLANAIRDYSRISGLECTDVDLPRKIVSFRGQRGTFHQETAEAEPGIEYLAPGHEWVDDILSRLLAEFAPGVCLLGESKDKHDYSVGIFLVYFRHSRTYKRYKRIFLKDGIPIPPAELSPQNLRLLAEPERLKDFLTTLRIAEEYAHAEAERIRKRFQASKDYWSEKVEDSHLERQHELEEKLQIQKGKMKWYKSAQMAGAIHRTINTRSKVYQERNQKIRYLRSLNEIETNIELKLFLHLDRSS